MTRAEPPEDGESYAADFLAALHQLSADEVAAVERQAVSELLDPDFYRATNPDVARAGLDPVDHFIAGGWRELRRPRPDFDVWWYWASYLDPGADLVDPLLHYAVVGRGAGLLPRPDLTPRSPGAPLTGDRPVRRAVLFAAFDADGVVDGATVHYLTELARHGEVFYLADCYIAPAEMAKLDGLVAAAWCERHGGSVVGSYARLATELVGWERLAGYDEVLLVDDSSYLVRPLDDVLARMDAERCDWWGLCATQGPAATVDADDIRVDPSFLALRSPVLADPAFRRLLGSVTPQDSELLAVQKYDVGLTHLLLGRGHRLATFVPELRPSHPLLTARAFELVEQGFPLLKQELVELNPLDVPQMSDWTERLLAAAPDARTDLFEERLRRTGADDRIRRSFSVSLRPDGSPTSARPLSPEAFREADAATAKEPAAWTFVVDPVSHRLAESSLALLHAASRRRGRDLCVLTRSHPFDVADFERSPSRVTTAPLTSPAGQQRLLRSGTVLVSGNPADATGVPLRTERRTVVTVRDGFDGLAVGHPPDNAARTDPASAATALLTTSDVDLLITLPHHWPLTYEAGLATGLPAHDLLRMPAADLPAAVRRAEERLRGVLGDRPLVLVAGGAAPGLRLSPSDARRLLDLADAHGAAVGVRAPAGDLVRAYDRLFEGRALDLSAAREPSRAAVLRVAAAVLTDDDGLALDLVLAGRRCHWLATDAGASVDDLRLFEPLPRLVPGVLDVLVPDAVAGAAAPAAPVPPLAERLLGVAPGATTRALRALATGELLR